MTKVKLSQNDASVSDDFPEIVLYHGTFISNLSAISQNGIVPVSFDISARLDSGLEDVVKKLMLSPEQSELLRSEAIQWAKERMEESGFKMVYLSGQEHYAISNASASSEWFGSLLQAGLRMKYEDKIEESLQLRQVEFEIHDRIKEMDAERHALSSAEEMTKFYDKMGAWENALRTAETATRQKSDPLNHKLKSITEEATSERFGEKVVILTVKMPYKVFRQKIVSPQTGERVERFEEAYREYSQGAKNWFSAVKAGKYDSVWEFFLEARLDSVEPQYIVDSKTAGRQ